MMKTMGNVMAKKINPTIDLIREDNPQLRTQVANLTIEARSTVMAKNPPTWTAPTTATPLPLITNPDVAVAVAERQTARQPIARKPTLQPMHALPAVLRQVQTLILTSIYSHPLARLSKAAIAVSVTSKLPVQQWTTVF